MTGVIAPRRSFPRWTPSQCPSRWGMPTHDGAGNRPIRNVDEAQSRWVEEILKPLAISVSAERAFLSESRRNRALRARSFRGDGQDVRHHKRTNRSARRVRRHLDRRVVAPAASRSQRWRGCRCCYRQPCAQLTLRCLRSFPAIHYRPADPWCGRLLRWRLTGFQHEERHMRRVSDR